VCEPDVAVRDRFGDICPSLRTRSDGILRLISTVWAIDAFHYRSHRRPPLARAFLRASLTTSGSSG
jgi:hypothetical protein